MKAEQALQKLIEGNQRFVSATSNGGEIITKACRGDSSSQSPFAVILGCSDSRVPAELVFYRGLGDLFVIRVAGNIVAPSQIGSVEFACQKFGTELVVVLGHTNCGAINATVDALLSGSDTMSNNLAAIVDSVTPAVHQIVSDNAHSDHQQLLQDATHANIRQSVQGLQLHSRIIRDLVKNNKLTIIGAEYSIETGIVDFLDQD